MRATHRRLAATFLVLTTTTTVGCADSTGLPPPPTGALDVSVSTTSAEADVDASGYVLRIDGGKVVSIDVDAALRIGTLATGPHVVRLEDVAPNCSVGGLNPQSVRVDPRDAVPLVSFVVSCVAPNGPDDGGSWDY
jgi:hypothetical protein